MDLAPLGRGIILLHTIRFGGVVCGGEYAAIGVGPVGAVVLVGREDDAVGAEVGEEGW
jgi:hypothetical protein